MLTTDANIQKRIERVWDRPRELDVEGLQSRAVSFGAGLIISTPFLLLRSGRCCLSNLGPLSGYFRASRVRRSSEAPGQLAGAGVERLRLMRAPVVVFERQKCMKRVAHGKSRADGAGDLACRGSGIRSFHGNPTPFPDMTGARRFSGPTLEELAKARILGVRAGTEHRYTGVWVVVVEGRVFVRSWDDKPTGWYRAFQAQPPGSIRRAGREIAVGARRLRGERLRDAVTRAYAGKYDTKASEKWVRGFAEPHRAATTLELLPVQPSPASQRDADAGA